MSKNPSAVTLAFEQAEWDIHLGIIPEEITKGSNLVLYRDGEYLLRENAIGVFFRKISDGLYRGLPMGPESFFKFSLPKIPKEILSKQVSFYRATMKRCNQAEAYSIVMYDKEKQEYFLVIPKQKVSKGSVQYSQKDLREKYPSNRYIEVISAHSHNTMGAYFSGIDDRDEQGDMVYMVMGKLDQPSPSFSIRANLYGKQCCFVSLEDIFDITLDEWNDLSPSWNDLHDINWMEQLNVEADYRSAHFEGSFTSERSRQRIPANGQLPTGAKSLSMELMGSSRALILRLMLALMNIMAALLTFLLKQLQS